MPLTDRSSKDVFLTSLFYMYYEQECIAKKLKTLLIGVRCVDAAAVAVPSATLAIIGFNPKHLQICIAVSGFINVIVAVLRFFPFYKKSRELHERSSRIEYLVSQMDITWRMYQFGLTSLETFTNSHKVLYEEYCRNSDDNTEVHDWSAKVISNAQANAMKYMEAYLSQPNQIADLFEKMADKEEKLR